MKILIAVFLVVISFCSCNRGHSKTEVEKAMNKYDSLIRAMDADAISKMFTPDGKLGEVAQGRDSIRRFLSSFVNVKVLSQRSTTKSIELKGDSSIQSGMYFQQALVDGKDTVNLKGNYTTNWKWINGEGWRIQKIVTEAIK